MRSYDNPTVRGEPVVILGSRAAGATGLGASNPANTVHVQYPDGERGYVAESDIKEG